MYFYTMGSIVISPRDQKEFEFIKNLLQKLGVKSKVLANADIEDLGMSILMKDVDRSDKVSESEVMKNLKG